MNIYENMVILSSALNDDEVKSAVDKISELITNSGGEVLKADNWGRRKLAYELNKQKMGVYIFFLFKSPSSTISKIESYFKVFDPVLKFMVIKLGKKQIAALPKEVLGVPVAPQVEA
ncbi:MAG: 30S ribosomal protein S6 [Nitrospirae bacterium]|nr:30S ribosomal protein S6 [Nitrospirota bacterium]